MRKLKIIVFLVLLTACNSENKESAKNNAIDELVKQEIDDTPLTSTDEQNKKYQKQREEDRKSYISDSVNFEETLRLGLKMANKKKDERNFVFESDTLNIRYGYCFSSSKKHLIINRTFPLGVQTDIYKLQDNNFVKVCSKDMHAMAYVGDTIQDVNGDNLKDYLFHWYPMSGCCDRDIYAVYLQKSNGGFTEEIEFINPNFSATEKVIRGRRYGYDAPLYKFKWNGYKVDTIEFIYFPHATKEGKYIKRKHENENEKGEVLKKIPFEYERIGYGY